VIRTSTQSGVAPNHHVLENGSSRLHPHFSVTAVTKGAIAPPRKLRDATPREIALITQGTICSPQI